MFLIQSEFESFFKSKLVIECAEIILTQQSSEKSKRYKGPGAIYQDKEGKLELKIYHRYRRSSNQNDDFMRVLGDPNLTAGKIIPNDCYYKMKAKDIRGRIWSSSNVWVDGDISAPTSTYVIKASLKEINSKITNDKNNEKQRRYRFYTPLLKRVPFNKNRINESGSSLSICEFDIDRDKCTIEKYDNYITIFGTAPNSTNTKNYSMRVLEALSLALGVYVIPMVKIITDKRSIVTTVSSINKLDVNDYIQSPIPIIRPADAVYLKYFVEKYVDSIKSEKTSLFGYWYRINRSFDSDLESKALVVTACIEGLLKGYYKNYGLPDKEYLTQVNDAKKKLKTIRMGQRARDRIMSSLGGKKSYSAKSALYQMVDEQIIEKDLAKAWVDTRNKAAHASELKQTDIEIQLLINGIYSCLELFYLLILLKIKYSGKYYSLSKEGWPESELRVKA